MKVAGASEGAPASPRLACKLSACTLDRCADGSGIVADDWQALNRATWDERVAVHLAPGGYDLAPLWAGNRRFDPIVEAELPRVQGRRVLHLQCHFGLDSLTLAQRGADVTGVDFSTAAIKEARRLTDELALKARFVRTDVYEAAAALGEPASFDVVFATWGTICWLPDIVAWAQLVRNFLKPGGALYFADAHPIALVFDDEGPIAGKPNWFAPYFGREPIVYEDDKDYANPAAKLQNKRQVNWIHPLTDILDAIQKAGLRLEWLHEHKRVPWRMYRAPGRRWRRHVDLARPRLAAALPQPAGDPRSLSGCGQAVTPRGRPCPASGGPRTARTA